MYYLKLYYKLLDWEWYTNPNVMRLFIHCLLKANRFDKKWHGIKIKAGSFITSYENLAFETGLTVRQVRTALDKLKITGELTNKTTSQYSMITINNWNEYQTNDKQNDKQMTDKRQTNDKQMTTTREYKNDKNDKSIISFIDEKKDKKTDPFVNSLNTYFCSEYKKVFNSESTVFLSYQNRDKLTELAAEYPNIRELIPQAIQKIKEIGTFRFKDRDFTPSASWLLKGDNFERVMNGEFDKKSESIPEWMQALRNKDEH